MSNDIEKQSLRTFTEKAYLGYAMYVILDRALPHLADGLKPVQRRIIYAMSELGLKSTAKYKKSARTVGDVLGKFHPHGDTACYEAMVLMAQPFSYRYPFVDGQGNWGSTDDPKSFAAMRYTEARLSAYANLLLQELPMGTVDWVDNFDGTLKEPSLLPARLPNALLNGAAGIAVGMSADLLPHNLTEVANACIHLLRHPNARLSDIMHYIQGPDFPTRAEIITPAKTMTDIYEQGTGSIKMRATYQKEQGNIVITELPYQVSGARVLEQIAAQMQSKKLPMIEDLRDESDHETPTRFVIIPRSDRVDMDELMSHLFATTDLEKNYRVNFNLIGLDGKPRVRGLVDILSEWLRYRLSTVRRRLSCRLEKVLDRIHVLEGLLTAYLNIDEIIAIIRNRDEPKPELMQRFNLTERQAEAILEIKLRHLAKLEEIKIKGELDELRQEQDYLQSVLGDERKLKSLVCEEIAADRDRYGDERRSPIVARPDAKALSDAVIVPNEPITVVLSQKGWIRAAKGYDVNGAELNYKSGDGFKIQCNARTNQPVLFFDSDGKVYSLPCHIFPSARSQGEPLTRWLNPADGQGFEWISAAVDGQLILIASSAGYGFIAPCRDLLVKSKNGKACLRLPESSRILPPTIVCDIENYLVACATAAGRLLIFPAKELPFLNKGKGNKLINIPAVQIKQGEDAVVALAVLANNGALVVHAGKRHFTIKGSGLEAYQGERGRRGNRLPRGFQNVSGLSVDG